MAGLVLLMGLKIAAPAVWEFELSLDEHIRFLSVRFALERDLVGVPTLRGGDTVG